MHPVLSKRIQSRFNKAAHSYDGLAGIQKDAAGYLIKMVLNQNHVSPKTIIDLGTGTGYVPELLLKKCPESFFYLNDLAENMLEQCKIKFSNAPNVRYLLGDMLHLEQTVYDWVISNFALQWTPDIAYTLSHWHAKSSKVFAFSMLLDGTLAEWERLIYRNSLTHNLIYPSEQKLLDICCGLKQSDQVFSFWRQNITIPFDHPRALMRYLQWIGASASDNVVCFADLKRMLKAESPAVKVTYNIFFGLFNKRPQ